MRETLFWIPSNIYTSESYIYYCFMDPFSLFYEGHWASDLILLVGGSSSTGGRDIAMEEKERMEEIVRGEYS